MLLPSRSPRPAHSSPCAAAARRPCAREQRVRLALAVVGALGFMPAARAQAQLFEQQKLLAPDAASGDTFGSAVAVSGERMLVGAHQNDSVPGFDAGAAYVYVRGASGWVLEQKLVASDAEAADVFGSCVALDGDTALIGAPAKRVNGVRQGVAYVFVRSGAGWSEQARLVASDGAARDRLGEWGVALDGDTALVGAGKDNNAGGADAGAAYVFVRSGTSWSEQQKLTASDGAAGDEFGVAGVAVSGDTILVGGWGHTHGGGPSNAGAAYIYTRAGTAWSERTELRASDGATEDNFGWAVALDGDTALVGARQDTDPLALFAGSAYVFGGAGASWSEQAKFTAADLGAHSVLALFGHRVALRGDLAVVGAVFTDHTSGSGDGAAYVFERNGTSWTQTQLVHSDGGVGDEFAWSVATDGSTVAIGAWLDDEAALNAGAAFSYCARSAGVVSYLGDGLAGDLLSSNAVVPGGTWSASVALGHAHGSGGTMTLALRTHTQNGPNLVSPLGGRAVELLIGGPLLGVLSGVHDGTRGSFPSVPVPPSACGLEWAAQATILGGGFGDLTNALSGSAGR